MTRQEKREFEILTALGLPGKPAKYKDDGSVWYIAVADIITREGKPDLAVVKNNPGKDYTIIRVFGSGGVGKILDVYPYVFVDEGKVPKHTAGDFVTWACKTFGVGDDKITPLTPEQRKALREKYLIDQHLKKEEAAKRKVENAEKARKAMAEHRERKENFINQMNTR